MPSAGFQQAGAALLRAGGVNHLRVSCFRIGLLGGGRRRAVPGAVSKFPFIVLRLEKVFTVCLLFLARRRCFLPWLSINNRGVRELLTLPHSVHETDLAWQHWATFQPHA
ncbi:hypothetical protein [Leisingera sp. McT4-56]|uniref:hypothetical protein n=1 Tax=Leisingera sp. McT4-56 TaxID=2881255 RepID=UPI001CF88F2F|nr:hypothetical protein [Leisingera sp. McT4-56]MCB4456757.1 hypothetical protein [Leisingera sp. McT4-56]